MPIAAASQPQVVSTSEGREPLSQAPHGPQASSVDKLSTAATFPGSSVKWRLHASSSKTTQLTRPLNAYKLNIFQCFWGSDDNIFLVTNPT